jgi:hypothetical protein
MLLISIPTPCHEKWNEMSPNEKGAFCGVCSKTVVDFTSLSDEEVQQYFLKQAGQKTCGRLRNDQLADNEDPLKKLLAASIPFWKKFLAIVLVVFGSLLTGCNNDNLVGDIAVLPAATTEVSYTTTGIIMPTEIDSVQKPDTLIEMCTETMGDIAVEPVEIQEDPIGIVEPRIEVVGEIMIIPKDENGNVKKDQEQEPY